MILPGKGMGWKEFFKALKAEWTRDDVSMAAGALTFFSVLALFPFLLFLVALAGLIINPEQANALVAELGRVAPQAVTDILGERIQSLAQSNSVSLLTIGALGAIWAASNGVTKLMRVLNTAYDVKESRPFWKVRGIAILVTLAAAVLSILAAVGLVALPPFANALPQPWGSVVLWLRWPVAALLVMLAWALIYYFLPDVEQDFKFITPGSVAGVIIWLLASWGFSLYVRNFGNYDATYGTLGGVIVLLLWMWISAQVVLLGAEINAILEHRSAEGKSPGEKKRGGEGGPPRTKGEKREEEERRRPLGPPRPEPAR
ncbi:MAG TPA: YihY/virulence factor BrkB family protein [Myxococcaceae bacterium]|nr:YihY/virulence factor BrkB family protein [Myxococcaceae bacterium]